MQRVMLGGVRCILTGLVLLGLTACGGKGEAATFPNLLWTYDVQDADVQFSTPTIADGVVYIAGQAATEGHSGHLVALDEATGAVQWDLANENLTLLSPLVSGKRVLAVERSGGKRTLFAVDAATGQTQWRGPGIRGIPVATTDLVWLIKADDHLAALALTDGQERFQRPISSRTSESLVLADGIIYLGDPDGTLSALNATDGSLLWQAATESRGYYNAAIVANGLVYLDAPLTAFDAKTGEVRWRATRTTDGYTPFVFGDALYVLGYPDTETLYALDAITGREKWSFTIPGVVTFRGTAWLTADQTTLFALGENDIYALDMATGAVKWQYILPRYPQEDCLIEFLDGPVLVDGVIFANTGSDKLSEACRDNEFTSQVRIDAATGTLLGETKAEETLFSHPEILFGLTASKGQLYQTAAGKLYVMKAR